MNDQRLGCLETLLLTCMCDNCGLYTEDETTVTVTTGKIILRNNLFIIPTNRFKSF